LFKLYEIPVLDAVQTLGSSVVQTNPLSKFIMSKMRKSKIIANPEKVPCSLAGESFTVKLVGF